VNATGLKVRILLSPRARAKTNRNKVALAEKTNAAKSQEIAPHIGYRKLAYGLPHHESGQSNAPLNSSQRPVQTNNPGLTFVVRDSDLRKPTTVIAYGDMRFTDPSSLPATNTDAGS
jgi:hypothetical protein